MGEYELNGMLNELDKIYETLQGEKECKKLNINYIYMNIILKFYSTKICRGERRL